MPIKAQQPPAEKENPYIPPGPEPLLFEQFQGINTSTTRVGVKDEQAWWLDGFMPIGPRFLRTMYGLGPALYTPAQVIVFFDFVNIGSTPYALIFFAGGGIRALNMFTLAVTNLAAAGTITSPSRTTIGVSQYGNQYAIITTSNQADGYFLWDGAFFYQPGGVDPFGGTMPTGVAGNAVETYAGRVWIANGSVIQFSAPGSVVDFSGASGGGNFSSSDSFLKVQYTQLKQTNGFLYLIGDSSVNYISGVQTTGTPPVTTFTNQNADPEVGSPWPGTVGVFGRNILFANAFGVHVSYGGAVTKISEPLDGVYNTVLGFGGLTPSAAKAIVFGKKIWILLLPIIDPVTGQQTNKLFIWNGKIWFSTPQDIELQFIQCLEIQSVITAFGTDGASIYRLFQTPSTAFTKVAQSRLWETPGGYQVTKAAVRLWGLTQYYSLDSPDLTIGIDNETGTSSTVVSAGPTELTWTNTNGDPIVWTNNTGAVIEWFSAGTGIVVLGPRAVGQVGVVTGLTVSTEAADMAIISLMLQDEIVGYRG